MLIYCIGVADARLKMNQSLPSLQGFQPNGTWKQAKEALKAIRDRAAPKSRNPIRDPQSHHAQSFSQCLDLLLQDMEKAERLGKAGEIWAELPQSTKKDFLDRFGNEQWQALVHIQACPFGRFCAVE